MPVPTSWKSSIYIGIDPGSNGGIAAIRVNGKEVGSVVALKTPDTYLETWQCLDQWFGSCWPVYILLERIVPGFKGTNKSSMAKLYGHYCALNAIVRCMVPFASSGKATVIEHLPARWEEIMGIPKGSSFKNSTARKNYMKQEAQRLFPTQKVTLATADALLLAECCRRINK